MGFNLTSSAPIEFTIHPLRTQLYPWKHLPSISIRKRQKWRTQRNIRCVKKYPSECRKPREKQVDTRDTKNMQDGYQRFVKVLVLVEKDTGKDHFGVSDALVEEIMDYRKLQTPKKIVSKKYMLSSCSFNTLNFPRTQLKLRSTHKNLCTAI